MSYLGLPRIFFRGAFYADAPTNNNLLALRPTVGTPGQTLPDWTWNPRGRGIFHLVNSEDLRANGAFLNTDDICRVISAWDSSGNFLSKPTDDPIIGASALDFDPSALGTSASAPAAKLADLDPEQRRVTELIGLRFALANSPNDGSSPTPWVTGSCQNTHLREFWMRGFSDLGQPSTPPNTLQPSAGNMPVFSASGIFQTVMTVNSWPGLGQGSKVLDQLKAASPLGMLSIRMVVTQFRNYENPATMQTYGQGMVLGVVGPYMEGEPVEFVAARRLIPISAPGVLWPFFHASAVLDETNNRLVVNLGNSIPWQIAPWTPAPADSMGLVILNGDGSVNANIGPGWDITTPNWLTTGGIATWTLTPAQTALAATSRLGLTIPQGDTQPMVLAEHPTGKYIDIDTRSIRLDPGTSVTVDVYATQLGKPLAGEVVPFPLHQQLLRDPDFTLGIVTSDQNTLINSEPADVITGQPLSVTTDANGHASLVVSASPGPITLPTARQYIDSQVYFLGDPLGWQGYGATGPPEGANCVLSVLVFNTHDPIANPVWSDVQPILSDYARIYPGMGSIMDISDEQTITTYASMIIQLLSLPADDPNQMPVTRDMSGYDRQLLISYLKSVEGTGGGGGSTPPARPSPRLIDGGGVTQPPIPRPTSNRPNTPPPPPSGRSSDGVGTRGPGV